jgi:chromosome segregation ATPase
VLEIIAAPATPAHEYVGCIRPEMGLRIRTALSSAARTRGHTTPHDEEIATLQEKLRAISIDETDTAIYRQRLAEHKAEQEKLRETVATERGRLQADADGATERRTDAIKRLSEVATTTAATRERLDRAREKRRERRDRREQRFRLEERIENRRRKARAHLVTAVQDAYEAAVEQTPGSSCSDPFEADPVTAALAITRVADFDAPVVLACDRFDSPSAACEWLDTPVLRV